MDEKLNQITSGNKTIVGRFLVVVGVTVFGKCFWPGHLGDEELYVIRNLVVGRLIRPPRHVIVNIVVITKRVPLTIASEGLGIC
jgi:hypothetical protein